MSAAESALIDFNALATPKSIKSRQSGARAFAYDAAATEAFVAVRESVEALLANETDDVHVLGLFAAARRAEQATFVMRNFLPASMGGGSAAALVPADVGERAKKAYSACQAAMFDVDRYCARLHEHALLEADARGRSNSVNVYLQRDVWFVDKEMQEVDAKAASLRVEARVMLLAASLTGVVADDDPFAAFAVAVCRNTEPLAPGVAPTSAFMDKADFCRVFDAVVALEAARREKNIAPAAGNTDLPADGEEDALMSSDQPPSVNVLVRVAMRRAAEWVTAFRDDVAKPPPTALLLEATKAVQRAPSPLLPWARVSSPSPGCMGAQLSNVLRGMRAVESRALEKLERWNIHRMRRLHLSDLYRLSAPRLERIAACRCTGCEELSPDVLQKSLKEFRAVARSNVGALPEETASVPTTTSLSSSAAKCACLIEPGDVRLLAAHRVCELVAFVDATPKDGVAIDVARTAHAYVDELAKQQQQQHPQGATTVLHAVVDACTDVGELRRIATSRWVPLDARKRAVRRMHELPPALTLAGAKNGDIVVWDARPISALPPWRRFQPDVNKVVERLMSFGIDQAPMHISVWCEPSRVGQGLEWRYEVFPSRPPLSSSSSSSSEARCSSDDETLASSTKDAAKLAQKVAKNFALYAGDGNGNSNSNGRITGVLSKPAMVNVGWEARKAIQIDRRAAYYAWAFPALEWTRTIHAAARENFTAFDSFLFWGGFVYIELDEDSAARIEREADGTVDPTKCADLDPTKMTMKRVCGCTSLRKGSALNFAAPQPMSKDQVESLRSLGVVFSHVTLTALKHGLGAKRFAWIPQDAALRCVPPLHTVYGGFAYLYGDGPDGDVGDPRNNFFSLLGPVYHDRRAANASLGARTVNAARQAFAMPNASEHSLVHASSTYSLTSTPA